jgi:hypothetical protein
VVQLLGVKSRHAQAFAFWACTPSAKPLRQPFLIAATGSGRSHHYAVATYAQSAADSKAVESEGHFRTVMWMPCVFVTA